MEFDASKHTLTDDALAGVTGGAGEAPQADSVTFACPVCQLKVTATKGEVDAQAVITCAFCHKQIKLLGFGLSNQVIRMRAECWE